MAKKEVDFYMPAFARRYPFVLAGDNANDRFVVCVDEKAECVTDKQPQQLFFDKDDTSQFTKEAFQFLQSFERDRQATQKMIEDFKALDLFEPKEMNFQGNNPDGTPAPRQKIADYFARMAIQKILKPARLRRVFYWWCFILTGN